jgi:hypothetical protein
MDVKTTGFQNRKTTAAIKALQFFEAFRESTVANKSRRRRTKKRKGELRIL